MQIREPIRVAVVFGPGRVIKPVWFDWHSCRHDVLETTYTWYDMKGNIKYLHFSVRDKGGLYELSYNTADQTWELSGLESG